MPYLTINEQQLYYARQGKFKEESPNILCVHGAGGDHLDWPPQLRRLKGAVVYAVDLLGHGRSDRPGRTTIEDYTDDLFRLVEELGLSNVVVVGHSMGGAIAQTAALRRPAWATGLVLIGSGARLRVADPILNQAANNLPVAASVITDLAWAPEAPADQVSLGHKKLLQSDPAVLYGDFSACNAFDVLGNVDKIGIPTLVICGSADQLTPVKYSQYLAHQIPAAELIIVDGAGHMAALEQPEVVAGVLEDFVKKIANSG